MASSDVAGVASDPLGLGVRGSVLHHDDLAVLLAWGATEASATARYAGRPLVGTRMEAFTAGRLGCGAGVILLLQPLSRARRGGAGGRRPRVAHPHGAGRGRGARARLGRAGATARKRALLDGGLGAAEVAEAVRRTGARVVHAHNLQPSLGWRAPRGGPGRGRVVSHLHNYRLVCAVGTCFTRDADCTRCHGRNTWPGVRLNCAAARAPSPPPTAPGWRCGSRRTADAFVVPSAFALGRLEQLGARRSAAGRG